MKEQKRYITLVFMILILAFIFTGCGSGSNSIVGTWTVDGYNIDGEVVSPETAVEWIGESFAANNDTKLVFQASGHVKAKFPMSGLDDTLDYTVTDDLIEVYDDSHSEYLTLDGDKILLEISSNVTMILKK